MATISIISDVFNKYHTNGKLRLSTGYIQEALEKQGYPGHDGIVQILKGKEDCGEQMGHPFTYRMRICDGIFQYNTLVSADIDSQTKRDADHLVEGTIIAITNLKIFNQGSGVKASFLITGYKLLSRYHQTLSAPEVKPRSHSGNPEEHRGYRPNIIVEDVWPEAEHLTLDFQENLSNPPAAKISKRESGGGVSHTRASVPEPPRARPAPPPARRATSNTERGVIPLAMVTPYVSNFKIHGMISRKEEIRTFPAKNTKVFNFEITDSNGDTIRCTAFNEAAESFYSTITENLSYYVSGGTVKQANKRFNNTGHDYEITLRNDSIIEAGGELLAAPKLNLKRVKLNEIPGHCGQLIDVLAVVDKIDPEATEFTSKVGKVLVKREMELIDDSETMVKLTLWGEEASKAIVDDYYQKVVAFKGVVSKEFNGGYSLGTTSGTRIVPVPEISGVAELYDWYTNIKPTTEVKLISQTSSGSTEAPRKISVLQEMQFGKESDRGDYASVKAMITRINPSNVLYKGCASEGCQKKVIESDGEYRCEKCNKSMNKFKWLYMMQFELSDETGQVYVTAFGDSAVKIVGKTAAEIGELKEENQNEYLAVFERLQFVPKMWRLRCKMETYNKKTVMLSSNGPRTAKISREVSNFIITQVLERSDDLIKNSYRRLTTENVARNEHWAKIAEKVTEKFDMPAEMERVKSHFHNRKKVLLARIKDELKLVSNSNQMTTDEKIDELVRRRICIGEYDEQLARVCLDIEEEEKGRTDQYGNDQLIQPVVNFFTETSHQSLLSQLLGSSAPQSQAERPISMSSPRESASSKDTELLVVNRSSTAGSSMAPLLSKLLSDPSTSKENEFPTRKEDSRIRKTPSTVQNILIANSERKRRAHSPFEKSNRSPILPSRQYLSHLIVDVTSQQELKRLLSLLIDNGFSRFQHVGSSDLVVSSNRIEIQRAPRPKAAEYINQELINDDIFEDEDTPFWPSTFITNKEVTASPESQLDIVNSVKNRSERVDVELKLEQCIEEGEEDDEEVDEQTAELEEQLVSDAIKNGLALFGKPTSPKKIKTSVCSAGSICGDVLMAICELCGIGIRLNSGGSKWNFYEHVMMKHSIHKPFKCPLCPYQAGRKVRVKQHGVSQHNIETEPLNMITPDVRKEWLETMSKCFPEHQYGKDNKS